MPRPPRRPTDAAPTGVRGTRSPERQRGPERGQERAPEGRRPHKPSGSAPGRTQERPHARPEGSEAGAPWLWGHHAVTAALANPARKILRFLATEEAASALPAEAAKPQIATKDEISRLLPPSAVHQGLALLAKPLKAPTVEDLLETLAEGPALVLVLDQVTDPHNIGAILRSAAGFGTAAVLLPDRNAPDISGTLAKSASGAVEHVPLIRVVNLMRTFDQLKKAGFWCIGLAGEAEKELAGFDLKGRVCLVLGSEGQGLRRLTREGCDLMARLPTAGPVASLNVSNAAAIALYEVRRQG